MAGTEGSGVGVDLRKDCLVQGRPLGDTGFSPEPQEGSEQRTDLI